MSDRQLISLRPRAVCWLLVIAALPYVVISRRRLASHVAPSPSSPRPAPPRQTRRARARAHSVRVAWGVAEQAQQLEAWLWPLRNSMPPILSLLRRLTQLRPLFFSNAEYCCVLRLLRLLLHLPAPRRPRVVLVRLPCSSTPSTPSPPHPSLSPLFFLVVSLAASYLLPSARTCPRSPPHVNPPSDIH